MESYTCNVHFINLLCKFPWISFQVFIIMLKVCFSVVQLSHSVVSDFVTPWTTAHQASLSITNSWSLLKLMSIKSATPFSHLILCHPLHPLPSVFPSIRVFSNGSAFHIRWPKYWSFNFSISLSNEYSELIFFSLQSKGLSKVFSSRNRTWVSCTAGRFFTI